MLPDPGATILLCRLDDTISCIFIALSGSSRVYPIFIYPSLRPPDRSITRECADKTWGSAPRRRKALYACETIFMGPASIDTLLYRQSGWLCAGPLLRKFRSEERRVGKELKCVCMM